MDTPHQAEARVLRRIPIHRSLVRPVLYLGCERESIGVLAILCLGGAVGTGFTGYALVVLGGLFILGIAALRRLTRFDADIRLVLVRYLWLDAEYAHAAEEDAEPRPIHPSVLFSE
jgi:type IV secretory pathway TrbD component